MKRIVAAIDGSASSLKAVEMAVDLAIKYDAELILLAAVRDFAPVVSADLAAYARLENVTAPFAEIGVEHAENVLAGARLTAQEKGAARVSTQTPLGDPAHQIIACAADQHADLIVIGSRGHGQLVGLLLGSVAQKVVAHAPCPVLVIW